MSVRAVFDTIHKKLPSFEMRTVFDIGANTGQTTAAILQFAPEARVYAVEPSPDAYAKLVAAYGDEDRVTCHNLALSRSEGAVNFLAVGERTDNRVVFSEQPDAIKVAALTGDALLDRENVATVDYLKIDTEGHDLDVLAGFVGAISRRAIKFVDVEVGMHAQNRRHVPFVRMHAFMEALGYPLFTIHELGMEQRLRMRLRRVNAVFASDALAHPDDTR